MTATAMPARPLSPTEAAAALRAGGVLAYPTEGVWGLGCDPFDEAAVRLLLALKRRAVVNGVFLVGADAAQFDEGGGEEAAEAEKEEADARADQGRERQRGTVREAVAQGDAVATNVAGVTAVMIEWSLSSLE